MKNFSHTHRR